jgi:c-di-GMP-binding flagellar brake protein YcgR
MERSSYRDKRKYPQFLLELPLEYQVGNTRNVSGGLVVNVSETGLLIRSVTDMAIGTRIEITVLFPNGYELGSFKVSAELIRKDSREGNWKGYEYGLRFLQMSEEDNQQLKQIIGGQLAA